MIGGAWPILVGEVTCLVNSDNGRDLGLLNRSMDGLTGEAFGRVRYGVHSCEWTPSQSTRPS